jgi:L-lactate dehydrogenase (cytochrome)
MRRKILGFESDLPFFIAPAAMAQLGHPDGELCLARGASEYNLPYCASDSSSISHAELMQYHRGSGQGGGALFYQLYIKKRKDFTIQRIRMARELGYKALVITADTAVLGIREDDERYRVRDAISKNGKYVPIWGKKPKEIGGDDYVFRGVHDSAFNWEDLQWVKEEWGNSGPICIKGIMTAEDAKIACELGVDAIYLSNHGGRQIDSGPSSLRTLLEIRRFYPEIFGKCEVLMDGGVRRSKDILKALCLGATAVGVGRPFMYALSAYGTEGVLKTIQSKPVSPEPLNECAYLLACSFE